MRLTRIVLWLLAGLFGLLVAVLLAGYVSWQLALDRDFSHTRETAELPLYVSNREGLLRVPARGMEFRARIAGLEPGRPVLMLLHGFPESSIMWAPLIAAVNDAGMAAVAFDQRGYSPGARPSDIKEYVMPELVRDVFAVADAIGVESFHVVGHDWGAAVAWTTAMLGNPRVRSVSALSIPHSRAFFEAILHDPEQRQRSGYMQVLRAPALPEYLLGTMDMRLLKAMHGPNEGEALDEYLRILREPGAMTAALNWYRASVIDTGDAEVSPMIRIPALFVGGSLDGAVAASGIEAQAKYMAGPFESHMRKAGHWLMSEDTEFVVATILDFVRRAEHPAQQQAAP